MDAPYDLTSPSNPRIKDVVGLRKRRTRDQSQTLVVEGYRELRRALDNGYALQTLFAAPEWFLGENEAGLIADARAAGARVFTVAKTAFARMSYRDRPDGLLGLGPYLAQALSTWTDLPDTPGARALRAAADHLIERAAAPLGRKRFSRKPR